MVEGKGFGRRDAAPPRDFLGRSCGPLHQRAPNAPTDRTIPDKFSSVIRSLRLGEASSRGRSWRLGAARPRTGPLARLAVKAEDVLKEEHRLVIDTQELSILREDSIEERGVGYVSHINNVVSEFVGTHVVDSAL